MTTTTTRPAGRIRPAPPPRWTATPACAGIADPEIFFPGEDEEDGPAADEARALCRRCPLLDSCRAYALATAMPVGIWGGLSTRERAALTGIPGRGRR